MRYFNSLSVAVMAASLVLLAAEPAARGQEVPKIAVIDVVKLLEESEPGRAGIESLRALQKQKNDQAQALTGEVADLRQRIADGQLALAQDKLEELQKQLEEKAIALKRFQDDANRELQTGQQRMLKEIQDKVMPIINQVGQEGGYSMIFNKFESGLVFASEAIDITDTVMERLNSSVADPAAAADSGS